ncbi:hypothetical protein D3C81_1068270 [compost metagenome]
MEITTGLQAASQELDQRRLHQPALVVLLFVPGVGEEDMHAIETILSQHVRDDLDGIVLHDANILNATLTGQLQQGANAGLVHLAAQEVVLRT